MLTDERLTALTAIHNGEVRAVHSAQGQYTYFPTELIVAIGFLMRTGMIQRDGKHVELTERGEHVLSTATAAATASP